MEITIAAFRNGNPQHGCTIFVPGINALNSKYLYFVTQHKISDQTTKFNVSRWNPEKFHAELLDLLWQIEAKNEWLDYLISCLWFMKQAVKYVLGRKKM